MALNFEISRVDENGCALFLWTTFAELGEICQTQLYINLYIQKPQDKDLKRLKCVAVYNNNSSLFIKPS